MRLSPCALLPLLCSLLLASCSTAKFYTQAVRGQMEILVRAKPIAEVKSAPAATPKLRAQLEQVEALRVFAHDTLRLPTHRQYRSYADLGRRFVVWNVIAAPEFSLEPKSWWYPLLGRLTYRGFFTEKDARTEAGKLKSQGMDVTMGGVRVYSTLGWFSDPVLNTFIDDEEAELAETLFHELTHARFFVNGDTDFNEAYATASAQLGVRAWLLSKGKTEALRRYDEDIARDRRVLELLKRTRSNLSILYAQSGTVSVDAIRREKARILDATRAEFQKMKRRGDADQGHENWVGKGLNNARLSALATYHDLVPAFTRLFHSAGGDWERFHHEVELMKTMTQAERRARLQGL